MDLTVLRVAQVALPLAFALWSTSASSLAAVRQPAADAYLVRDIRPSESVDRSADSVLSILPAQQGWVPVWARGPNGDSALLATDGTAEGTRVVSDEMQQAYAQFTGRLLCRAGETLYFWRTYESREGLELWKTDGTAEGTVVLGAWPRFWVGTVRTGDGECGARTVNGRLLFSLFNYVDWTSHSELWSTDGTQAGTTFIRSLGSSSNYDDLVRGFAVYKGRFYFGLEVEGYGSGMWSSDGTAAGTSLLSNSVWPDFFRVFGDRLYFSSDRGYGHSFTFGVTDGTVEGTRTFFEYEFPYNLEPLSSMVDVGGSLVFAATREDVGQEIWAITASGVGPAPLTDLPAADVVSPFGWEHGSAVSGRALFWVSGPNSSSGGTSRTGLFASDGSIAGTSEVHSFPPSPDDNHRLISIGFISGAGLFQLEDGDRCGLWRSDGTPGGTFEFTTRTDYCPETLYGAVSTSSRVYFSWGTPWASDGTAAGTAELVPWSELSIELSFNENTAVLPGDDLLFALTTHSAGTELWRSDGSVAGTRQVLDLTPSFLSSQPAQLSGGGERIVFFANDDEHGSEPWASDGTEAGTHLLADLAGGSASSAARTLGYLESRWPVMLSDTTSPSPRLYLTSGEPGDLQLVESGDGIGSGWSDGQDRFDGRAVLTNSWEIWSIAEAPPRATLLADGLYLGFDFFTEFYEGVRGLYYARMDGHAPAGVWVTDGTVEHTRLFCGSSEALYFTWGNRIVEFGAGVAFASRGYNHSLELWVCDHEGSTAQPLNLSLWGIAQSPANLTPVGDQLVFAATDVAGDRELWVTDGTTEGSALLVDIFAGGSSQPDSLFAFDERVLFVANDGVHGRELWITDGSAAGTMLVTDLAPGLMSSSPADFHLSHGAVVFTAGTPATGRELWVTTGTPESTRLLADSNPGPASSVPTEITPTAGRIFFRATDAHGAELWAACPGWGAEADLSAPLANESAGSLAVAVHLSVSAACGGGRFTLEVVAGTATANVDFVAATQEVTFAVGVADLETAITLLDDDLPEDGETVRLILRDVLHRVVAEREALIVDDDGGADADGDGIASAAEMQAPNGGDGNSDGLADAFQPAVASYALATPGAGVTIELGADCSRLSGVEASLAEHYTGDPDHRYPGGLVRFVASDCAGAEVRVLLHGLPAADCASGSVRKVLRREPASAGPEGWLTVDGAQIAAIELAGTTVCALNFRIEDGGVGDLSPAPREIDDPVGLGVPTSVVEIPTLSSLGVTLFAVLLLLGAWLRLARSRRAS